MLLHVKGLGGELPSSFILGVVGFHKIGYVFAVSKLVCLVFYSL